MAGGRRLSDGAFVAPEKRIFPRGTLPVAVLVLGIASCPSHDSFAAYLSDAASHPSGFLGGLSALGQRLRVAVSAESKSYFLCRIGRFRGYRFLGCFGTWISLPDPSFLTMQLPILRELFTSSFCGSAGGGSPHEAFVLLCIVGFACWHFFPRVMYRHAVCSLRVLQSGRVWTLITSNLSHASPMHLLHNMMQLLHFGPVLKSVLGCEKLLLLISFACIAASTASVIWHGFLSSRFLSSGRASFISIHTSS